MSKLMTYEIIQLINNYEKTWSLLLAYDENTLQLPEEGRQSISTLDYKIAINAISSLKSELSGRHEATAFFGNERDNNFSSILGNIEQTFDGKPLYKSVEEKAAHLLYFIIKDHPFIDGNKRIGSFIFLLYLKTQNVLLKFNENSLVMLALLIAESDPSQKELIIRLIVNFLIN